MGDIPDWEVLAASLGTTIEIIHIDASADGLEQIAQWADAHHDYEAIRIFSHGGNGTLHLGTLTLQDGNIDEHAHALQRIGAALVETGDVLLYGCDVAQDNVGRLFVQHLSRAMNADVAASTNPTGSKSLGGDWMLEYQSGAIETSAFLFDAHAIPDWHYLLASIPTTPGGTTYAEGTDVDTYTYNGVGRDTFLLNKTGTYTFTGHIASGGPNDSSDVIPIEIPTGGYVDSYTLSISNVAINSGTQFFVSNGTGTLTRDTALTNQTVTDDLPENSLYTFMIGNGVVVLDYTLTLTVVGPPVPPTLTATSGNPAFTEGSAAVDLFNGVTASTNDAGDTFVGAQIRVTNVSDGAREFLSIGGTSVALSHGSSGTITGTGSYSVSKPGTTATVTLTGMTLSDAQMSALIDGLSYHNTSDDPGASDRVVTVRQLTDSNSVNNIATLSTASTVSITAVNDAPTLTATGGTPTFTENGLAVSLFSGTSAGAIEASQNLDQITLTVANLADASAEILGVDGSDVALTHGNSVTTVSNALTVSVSVAGSTATVTIGKTGGITASVANTLIDGLTYRNTSDTPNTTNRIVTLTSIHDTGGTANGGVDTTSLSLASTVVVNAVNDAPTLTGGPYALTGMDENTTSSSTLVSTILTGLTHSDADAGASSGIAVTAASGNGAWHYSTDGVTWNSVGAVTGAAALLLASSSQLRYLPDGQNGETPVLTFRAWDQTSGTASTNSTRSTADTTTYGASTAFSVGTAQATLAVSATNDAPVLTPSTPTLTGISDGAVNNAGQTVASIVGTSISDVDTGAVEGIAVSGLNSGNGTWQYSMDSGTSWQDIGSVSGNSALLLRANDLVRFVPDGIHGTSASLTYRAWDQSGATAGLQGTKIDTSSNGATTPFSTASDAAGITVTAINDAPTLTTSSGATAFVEGDNVASTPVVVDSGLTLSDLDSPTLASATVAISGNFHAGQDTLGFAHNPATMGDISGSYNSGTGVLTLTSSGGASPTQWQAALRSVTYDNGSEAPNTGNRTISFAIDDGLATSTAATKVVSVAAVNDAPTVSVPASIAVTEDSANAITGISFSDADAGGGSITVSLAVPTGTLAASSGGGVTVGGTASALTLTGTVVDINAFITGNNVSFTGATNATGNVTLTASINDGGNSGNGGAKIDTDTITLAIAAVNDAPSVNAPAAIAVTEDVTTALTSISFSDVDASSGTVQVTLSVPTGTLNATSGGGVTISGSGSGLLMLSGRIIDINAFLAGSNATFTPAANSTTSVTLTVTIDDGGNTGSGGSQTAGGTVTLALTAVNDAPVNSVPASQAVLQDATLVFNNGNGNLVSVSDVDAGSGTVRVTLTASNGLMTLNGTTGLSFSVGSGTADGTMTLEGMLADINLALDGLIFSPTAGYYGPASVQITSNDLGLSGSGGNQTDTDTIAINVAQPIPVVTRVSAGSVDGAYKMGDTLSITIEFDQAITVDTTGGTPSLLLETGILDSTATYVSGSGSKTLTFAYTVQAGDASTDLNYASTTALALNGATVRNASNLDANLTLPTAAAPHSLASQKDLLIDGIAPAVSSVAVPADGIYASGAPLDFTVQLNEAVTVDTTSGTPRIAVVLDTGGTAYASYVSGSGTNALVFRLIVANGQADLDGITLGSSVELHGGTLKDAVGNNAVLTLHSTGPTTGVLVDAVAPVLNTATVTGNQLVLTYTEASTLDAGHPPGIGDFAVTAGGTGNAVTGVTVDATAKTVTLTLTTAVASGQTVTVAYTDPTAGNDAHAIQDAAGNDAASFAASPVTNNTPAPTPPPPPPPEPVDPTPLPPPPPPPPVGDQDGIPDAQEDLAPGIAGPGGGTPVAGDGNGDGIKDSLQAEVASIAFVLSPTAQSNPGNAPPTFTTLVTHSQDGKVSSGTSNSRITSLGQNDAPTDRPEGLDMPIGLVSFTVQLLNGASSESFSLYVDASLGVNGYWKQDSTGTWVNLASAPYGGKTVMEGGRLRLDFQIADGGEFDADGTVDGIITDPGAPAHLPLSIVGQAPELPVGGFWF